MKSGNKSIRDTVLLAVRLAASVLLMAAWCGVAGAQAVGRPIDPGSRVRVTILSPPDRVSGSLLRYDRSAIMIEEQPAIPWTSVSKLELSAGRHGNSGKGAFYGALIGLVLGVATGMAVGQGENAGESGGDLKSEFSAGFGLAGLLAGAGIGAIVGSASESEDWLDIPLANPAEKKP